MQYAQGDLAILSAETYDPGSKVTAASRAMQKRSTENQKKRKSPAEEVPDQEEEEKKRTRGRPRLDTKDETAAERRRTQIRLAQRAYRNRKENAIQSLDKRVQGLKETNEAMSNAFMKLHDFAVQSGLLERAPDFAEQLRGTTQIFLSLAQQSNDDGAGDDDQLSNPDHTPRDTTAASRIEKQLSERVVEIPAPAVQPSKTETPTYGGFMVTHEPLSPTTLVPPTHDVHSGMGLGFDTSQPNLAGDYEVVTYPTADNATFALGADFDFTDIGNSVNTPLSSLSPPSVYNPLPAPQSYASTEMTFGRRLQRTAAERAWTLISMPNPPPKRFARVFGFCLLFESHDSIKKRLSAVVERNREESLSNWEYPFLQLGGAGTHYDLTSFGGSPIGNQGTVNLRKPKSNTGFGTGPFNEKIMEAGALLDKNMRINLPGFSAEFFDCDEVEVYLRERGITIPGGADYVTAEVDMTEFEGKDDTTDAPFPPFEHFGTTDFQEPNRYRPQYEEIQELDAINELNAPIRGPTFTSRSSSSSASDGASTAITIPSPETDPASKGWSLGMATAEPLLGAFGHHDTSFMNTMGAVGDFSANSGILAFTGLTHNVKRQVVTIDVNMLMFEMTERSACLGRSPGLRKDDINAAFRVAIRGS